MTIRHDESVEVCFVQSYKTKYVANVLISMPGKTVRLGIVNKALTVYEHSHFAGGPREKNQSGAWKQQATTVKIHRPHWRTGVESGVPIANCDKAEVEPVRIGRISR